MKTITKNATELIKETVEVLRELKKHWKADTKLGYICEVYEKTLKDLELKKKECTKEEE